MYIGQVVEFADGEKRTVAHIRTPISAFNFAGTHVVSFQAVLDDGTIRVVSLRRARP